MGNSVAMGMAMNRMHEELLAAIGQLKTDSHQKYNALAKDLSEIKETSQQLNNRLLKAAEDIDLLKKEKADKDEVQKLTAELKSYREETEKRLQGLSNAIEGSRGDMEMVKYGMHRMGVASKLENDRIRSLVTEQEERVNILEIKHNKLHLNVDGVPENTEVSPALLIISKFNTDTKADLKESDIKSAWRIGNRIPDDEDIPALQNLKGNEASKGKDKAKRKPRTISVILASENARDKIMSNRSKLKKYENGTFMWINKDQPEAYRRRKSMLRDLVKLAKKKGYKDARIESGGIKVDGIVYMPDNFCDLPDPIKPREVRIRKTKNGGLAFCSEWAFLSNLYPAPFVYNDKMFSSVEQCYQMEKALFHNEYAKANKIICTDDPHKCKKHGRGVPDSPEWIGTREGVMKEIVLQKFVQNEELQRELIDTGNAALFEAVTGSSVWSINSSIYAKATYEETATGPNVMGKILQDIRSKLAPPAPPE